MESAPHSLAGVSPDGERSAAASTRSAAPARTPEALAPRDVWSSTDPRYLLRAISLLMLNLLLFCGLCIFAYWLRFGQPFDFSLDSYVAPARFWGQDSPTLYDFVLDPISVERVPIHAVVLGLTIGSIVAVPIAIAILYRFVWAIPFGVAIAVFAHMPWMSLTVLGGCVLAAVRPFRLRYRFGAGLVGLLPFLVYLLMAGARVDAQFAEYVAPTSRALLAAPWVLAILAACVMLGVTLMVARLVEYRAGAVAPVVAVMFAAPLILFHSSVGVDELAYRVLEKQHGPQSPALAGVLSRPQTVELIRHQFLRALGAPSDRLSRQIESLLSADPQERRRLRTSLEAWFHVDFLNARDRAVAACRQFIADHPRSRYVPNVLYLQGRAIDLRFDSRMLFEPAGRRVLYDDFPHADSEIVWTALANEYPRSPLSVVARLRLAQLALRRGDVDAAAAILAPLEPQPTASAPTEAQPSFLRKRAALASLGFEPLPHLRNARTLAALLRENRADPQHGQRPLAEFSSLDARLPGYRESLEQLLSKFPDSLLADNLRVEHARADPDRAARAIALTDLMLELPASGDAVIACAFHLGELELLVLGADDEAARARGLSRLERLVAEHRDSPYAEAAAAHLDAFDPTVKT